MFVRHYHAPMLMVVAFALLLPPVVFGHRNRMPDQDRALMKAARTAVWRRSCGC